MLPSYYQHVYRYENSLVTKFYGVHCVKPIGGPKVRYYSDKLLPHHLAVCILHNVTGMIMVNIHVLVCLYVAGEQVRFIIMGNLFCSDYHIHRRFDLKGSSYGRSTDKSEEEIDEMTTLKDLDLNYIFRLHRSWYLELLE